MFSNDFFVDIARTMEAQDNLLDSLTYALRKAGFPAARVTNMSTVAVEVPDNSGDKHIFVLRATEPEKFDWDEEMREYEKLTGDTLEEDVDRLVSCIKVRVREEE